MRRRPLTLRESLGRALAAPLLLFVTLVGYSVPSYLVAGTVVWPTADRVPGEVHVESPVAVPPVAWTVDLEARFPHCVAPETWRSRSRAADAPALPTGLVVLHLDGSPALMSYDAAHRRALSSDRTDDVWVVGWCD